MVYLIILKIQEWLLQKLYVSSTFMMKVVFWHFKFYNPESEVSQINTDLCWKSDINYRKFWI